MTGCTDGGFTRLGGGGGGAVMKRLPGAGGSGGLGVVASTREGGVAESPAIMRGAAGRTGAAAGAAGRCGVTGASVAP